MYPAIEIDLPLNLICPAQRQVQAMPGAAFRSLTVRDQPAPFRGAVATEPGHGSVIARTRKAPATS